MVGYLYRGRCPRLLMVVPSRHQSDYGGIIRGRIPSRGLVFILVYRLDEDGDLQDEGGAQAFGLGVKSSLL